MEFFLPVFCHDCDNTENDDVMFVGRFGSFGRIFSPGELFFCDHLSNLNLDFEVPWKPPSS